MTESRVTFFCDGASRGNPGDAAFGVVAFRGERPVTLNSFKENEQLAFFFRAERLGKKTNNEAEYAAMIAALSYCADNGIVSPTICSDSELVIKQLRGEYKVKNENLKPLHAEATRLKARVKPELIHVRREKNEIADYLANRALDTQNR